MEEYDLFDPNYRPPYRVRPYYLRYFTNKREEQRVLYSLLLIAVREHDISFENRMLCTGIIMMIIEGDNSLKEVVDNVNEHDWDGHKYSIDTANDIFKRLTSDDRFLATIKY